MNYDFEKIEFSNENNKVYFNIIFVFHVLTDCTNADNELIMMSFMDMIMEKENISFNDLADDESPEKRYIWFRDFYLCCTRYSGYFTDIEMTLQLIKYIRPRDCDIDSFEEKINEFKKWMNSKKNNYKSAKPEFDKYISVKAFDTNYSKQKGWDPAVFKLKDVLKYFSENNDQLYKDWFYYVSPIITSPLELEKNKTFSGLHILMDILEKIPTGYVFDAYCDAEAILKLLGHIKYNNFKSEKIEKEWEDFYDWVHQKTGVIKKDCNQL